MKAIKNKFHAGCKPLYGQRMKKLKLAVDEIGGVGPDSQPTN